MVSLPITFAVFVDGEVVVDGQGGDGTGGCAVGVGGLDGQLTGRHHRYGGPRRQHGVDAGVSLVDHLQGVVQHVGPSIRDPAHGIHLEDGDTRGVLHLYVVEVPGGTLRT